MIRALAAMALALLPLAAVAAQGSEPPAETPCPHFPNQFTCDSPVYAMTNLMAVYEICTIVDPTFGSRHAAAYDAWLKLNASTLERLRRNKQAPKVHKNEVAQFRIELARMTPTQRETRARTCETVIPPGLLQNLDEEYRPR